MTDARASLIALEERLGKAVLGQPEVARSLMIALLTGGNVLLEGLPGTAKTRSIKALGTALGVKPGRIQFTVDLLPTDVTGTELYLDSDHGSELVFQPGPIFNNLVLADEINRAPPKVQAALLEAMEEKQVTASGKTHSLPDLFLVMATQNPIEQEGTYPLPEAQLDRFMLKIRVDYPAGEAEREILRLVRSEEVVDELAGAVTKPEAILDARKLVSKVHVSDAIDDYIVALVMATREPDRYEGDLASWIDVGVSPRASIALDRAARAGAWLQGRDHVDPDDVRGVVHAVLRHRLVISYDAMAAGKRADDIIDEMLRLVAVA